MSGEVPCPQINVSKFQPGTGVAGAIFTLGSVLIFLIGIPALWCFLGGAIVLGGLAGVAMRLAGPGRPPESLGALSKESSGRSRRGLGNPPLSFRWSYTTPRVR